MVECIIIGQMAVYTLKAPVRPSVEPGLIAAFHDVATAAELGTSRPGIEFRGAKGQKGPDGSRYYSGGHEDQPELPALHKFQHNATDMKNLNPGAVEALACADGNQSKGSVTGSREKARMPRSEGRG